MCPDVAANGTGNEKIAFDYGCGSVAFISGPYACVPRLVAFRHSQQAVIAPAYACYAYAFWAVSEHAALPVVAGPADNTIVAVAAAQYSIAASGVSENGGRERGSGPANNAWFFVTAPGHAGTGLAMAEYAALIGGAGPTYHTVIRLTLPSYPWRLTFGFRHQKQQ